MNKKIVALYRAWELAGYPPQEPLEITLLKENWIREFNEQEVFIKSLPNHIGREEVRQICESRDYRVSEKFFVTMIWGYSDRGYGPYRVRRILGEKNFLHRVEKLYEYCSLGDVERAYVFSKENSIKGFGPSYVTKFLNFCTPRKFGAPIFDSLVLKWIDKEAKGDLGVNIPKNLSWNSSLYFSYRNWVLHHSKSLKCFPDEIEFLIFQDSEVSFSKRSYWKNA